MDFRYFYAVIIRDILFTKVIKVHDQIYTK